VRRVGERSLRSVFEGAFDTGSPLRDGLKRWVAEGDAAADVFNGPRDSLNLDRSRLVTFEMGQVISGGGKDVRLAGALVSYIMHRIRERCRADAAPHMVFIDETAALLADDAFRRDVEVMLREHRKLRGSVNLAFQDVSVMLNSGIGETVLNNCPTHIIFQNPNARWEDYEVLGLTEGQWAYVKGTSRAARHLSRSFLLKRGQEAVILDCDLTPLGPLLKIYRSGAETARLVRELKAQVGDRWVEVFINMDV
jgi:type IV secretion system protein VirB4